MTAAYPHEFALEVSLAALRRIAEGESNEVMEPQTARNLLRHIERLENETVIYPSGGLR